MQSYIDVRQLHNATPELSDFTGLVNWCLQEFYYQGLVIRLNPGLSAAGLCEKKKTSL